MILPLSIITNIWSLYTTGTGRNAQLYTNCMRYSWFRQLLFTVISQLHFNGIFFTLLQHRIYQSISFNSVPSLSQYPLSTFCIFLCILTPRKIIIWNAEICLTMSPTSAQCNLQLAWMEPSRSSYFLEN